MIVIESADWWNALSLAEKETTTILDLATYVKNNINSKLGIHAELFQTDESSAYIKFPWQDGSFHDANVCMMISIRSGNLILDQTVDVRWGGIYCDGEYTSTMGTTSYTRTPYTSGTSAGIRFAFRYLIDDVRGLLLYGAYYSNFAPYSSLIMTKLKRIKDDSEQYAIISDGAAKIFLDNGVSRRLEPASCAENSLAIMVYPFNDGVYKHDDLFYSNTRFLQLASLISPSQVTKPNGIYNDAFSINTKSYGVIQARTVNLPLIFEGYMPTSDSISASDGSTLIGSDNSVISS